MIASKLDRYWILTIILLVAVIVVGSIVACLKYSPGKPIEISLPTVQEFQRRVYIGGNVTNPGLYPFNGEDTIDTLIQVAGGISGSVNLSELKLKLYIPGVGEAQEPQKVDINRAEEWLLKALPGIGQKLADDIVAYRQKNGPFHDISELTKVAGIGTAKYEQIKGLITVTD